MSDEKRRLKILQAISGTGWSGGQQQTLYLMLGLRERGHDVKLACEIGSILAGKARDSGIEVFEFPMKREADFYSMYALYKLFKRERFDVVNVQRPTVHTLALVASVFSRIPVFVVTRRVLYPIKSLISAKIKYQFRVNSIISVSDAVKDVLVSSGVGGDKIVTIFDGIDFDRFDPKRVNASSRIRGEFGIPADANVVSMIANYSEEKHDCFLRAVPLVLKELPNTYFILAGRATGPETFGGIADSLGISKNVILAGFRGDVPEILSATDLSINSAVSEGLSGALIESFAMGVPCVASNVGGIPELVKDGVNGLLVPPLDPDALAAAIVRLLRDVNLMTDMAKRCRDQAYKSFSIDAMVDKTEALYLKLMDAAFLS